MKKQIHKHGPLAHVVRLLSVAIVLQLFWLFSNYRVIYTKFNFAKVS
jgi:hypothetical protein